MIKSKIKNRNTPSKIFSINLILTIIITIYIAYTQRFSEYSLIFILPLSYTVILTLFSNIFINPKYEYGLLFYAAQFFIFIRFVITPLSMVVTSNEYRPGPDPTNIQINLALILMIYELLSVFLAISISLRRLNKNNETVKKKEYSLLSNKFIVGIVTIILFIVVIGYPEQIIPQLNIDNPESLITEEVSGIVEISVLLFKCLSFLFLLSLTRYKIKNKRLSFLCSLFVLLVFIILFIGKSRWTLIFMSIAGLYVVVKLYPKKKKFLVSLIVIILIISILYVSISKFWWAVDGSENPIRDIILHMSSQFQAYFSGPRQVAQSTNLKNVYSSISAETFFNDFLGSVPGLSHFINQSDRINVYFNLYNYSYTTTLIVPLIGIGYTYFGFLLSPIFTFIAQWLIIKIDYSNQLEHRLEFVFIYTYLGLRLSMSMGLNTQSLFYSFLIPTIPLIIIFFLNDRIYLFKRKRLRYRLRS